MAGTAVGWGVLLSQVDLLLGLGGAAAIYILAVWYDRTGEMPWQALATALLAAGVMVGGYAIYKAISAQEKVEIARHHQVSANGNPNAVVATKKHAWVTTPAGRIWEIYPKLGPSELTTLDKGGLYDIDRGFGALWVTQGLFLVKLDPRTGEVLDRYSYGRKTDCEVTVAPDRDGLWFKDYKGGRLTFVGKNLGPAKRVISLSGPNGMAYGMGRLWVTKGTDEQATGQVLAYGSSNKPQHYTVESDPQDITVARGYVWIAHSTKHQVTRLDPRADDGNPKTFDTGLSTASGIASGAGALWVSSDTDGKLSQINVDDLKSVATYRIGASPYDVAVGGRYIYVPNLEQGGEVDILAAKP